MHFRRAIGVAVAVLFSGGQPDASTQARPVDASQTPPTGPLVARSRTFCALQGPVVHVPSALTPEGIRVRISSPVKARYVEGAPVVVHSTAAPSIDRINGCVRAHGFIEVAFDCPETRSGDQSLTCTEALADVLAFATGRVPAMDGSTVASHTGDIKVAAGNVGMIGWSAGGNRAIVTMARYGDRFPALKWYASWESPVLSPVDGGWGSVFQTTRFYDTSTGVVDFTLLRYSPDMPLWIWIPSGVRGDTTLLRGGLYLDGDGNERFNKDADYAFWATYRELSTGGPRKALYTPTIVRAARERKVFGRDWPDHIATVDEVDEYAAKEFPLPYIPNAVRRFPELPVIVFESVLGHVTTAADHPHAIAQVNGWLDAGARWVRLNPDTHYVAAAMLRAPASRVHNAASIRLDRKTIGGQVLAEDTDGGPTDAQGMGAAASELADRTRANNWSRELSAVLVRDE